MKRRRVVLVGDSIFTETLGSLLERSGAVKVMALVASPREAIGLVRGSRLDAVIVASADPAEMEGFGELVAALPGLPVIRANLTEDLIQVVTSQQVEAHLPDLVAAIRALPRRASRSRRVECRD